MAFDGVSVSSIQKELAKRKSGSVPNKVRGGVPTFTVEEYKMLDTRLDERLRQLGTLSREIIVAEAHAIILSSARPLEARAIALTRCGGARWLRDFSSSREVLRCHLYKRPIEIERAQKAQPEYTVMFLRMQFYAHGLCQIHRA